MEDPAKATPEPCPKESQIIGRRELLKALTAGSGAMAASTLFSGKWVKPVIEVGLLPAHAQASAIYVYFGNPPTWIPNTNEAVGPAELQQPGPSAILIVVNGTGTTAHVTANNNLNNVYFEIDLDINGSPSNNFTFTDPCEVGAGNGNAMWNVVNYTLGDPSIFIHKSGGEGVWTIEVPLGTGPLPPIGVPPCPG